MTRAEEDYTNKLIAEVCELRTTLRWVALALPVLETMCRVAGLRGGQAKAREMIEYLHRRHQCPDASTESRRSRST